MTYLPSGAASNDLAAISSSHQSKISIAEFVCQVDRLWSESEFAVTADGDPPEHYKISELLGAVPFPEKDCASFEEVRALARLGTTASRHLADEVKAEQAARFCLDSAISTLLRIEDHNSLSRAYGAVCHHAHKAFSEKDFISQEIIHKASEACANLLVETTLRDTAQDQAGAHKLRSWVGTFMLVDASIAVDLVHKVGRSLKSSYNGVKDLCECIFLLKSGRPLCQEEEKLRLENYISGLQRFLCAQAINELPNIKGSRRPRKLIASLEKVLTPEQMVQINEAIRRR